MSKSISMSTSSVLSAGYSYHTQPFYVDSTSGVSSYLFRLQTEGTSLLLVQGRRVEAQPGDLMLYKPGEPYELRIDSIEEAPEAPISSGDYYVFCRGDWVDEWWERARPASVTRLHRYDKLVSIWRHLILEKRDLHREHSELTDYLLRVLCLQIDRAIDESSRSPAKGRVFLAYRMKQYVEEHAIQPFKLEDVARHVGISVSRAVHLYKEVFGQTLMQYAMDIRLTLAVERMLYGRLTLEQVAETCGFGSYSYFHRAFRAKYGLAPKAYRSKHLYEE
jgi:AraC family transcriptional regulator, arabinose operon regulatory protein